MSITATGISKRFGTVVALDDVTVDVPDRSLTALLGPSGGGKSTLLRVLAGLERPDTGTVRIEGADVTRVPVRERGIGFVFQHYAAFRHLTVADNVGFALAVRRRPKKEIRARVEELLALVRLDGLAGRYPSQLSGGQRQRMALARALAAEPRVLLLDEPFGALDAAIRAELREWLRRLHEQIPVTTIVVTHDQEEALELADQIVLVHRGRVEQAGSPSDVYHRPASPFVMTFVGASTRLHGGWHRPHDIDLSTEGGPGGAHWADGGTAGTVARVTPLTTHTRVDVTVPEHAEPVVVHLPHGHDELSRVRAGRAVRLHPRYPHRFGDQPTPDGMPDPAPEGLPAAARG
jgi:sulfate transport system ATP-binding protein